jgi:spermidine synthase
LNLRKLILMAFVFSGMAALIYEVVWTRPLQFVLGSTIYTVSIIFSAFMGGLALGSFIASKYVDRIKNLPATYAFLELGIGLYGALLLVLFNILPDAYRAIYYLHESFYIFEFGQLIVSFLLLLIPTALMGATFPIIVKFYTQNKIGKGVGEVYSANNIGAILGSFLGGFLLLPILGIKTTLIFAGIINVSLASIILLVTYKKHAQKIIAISAVMFFLLAMFANYDINQLYSGGLSRSIFPKELVKQTEFLFYKEGIHATIAVTKDPIEGARAIVINGKGQGSNSIHDLRVMLLLAYLPLILNPGSKKDLVIGLGTGVTSGHLANVRRVTTLEIEPAVAEASDFFKPINLEVLDNPNHELIITEGRNYLLRSKEKWDTIIPEPSDPWQSFSSVLFTKEFFELAGNHLSEDGIFVQWVPIFELNLDDFKSFYKTFNSVFPHVTAFVNIKDNEQFPVELSTTELIFIGSKKEMITGDQVRENFESLSFTSKEHLSNIWISSEDDLLNLLLFTSKDLEGYADDAELITDDNLRLEFSASKKVLNGEPMKIVLDVEKYISEHES